MKRVLAIAGWACALLAPSVCLARDVTPAAALAQAAQPIAERAVSSAHLRLGDVMPDAPEAARDVELGPSPAPGASRLVTKDELLRSLHRAGVNAMFALPATVRVTRSAEHLSRHAFEDLSKKAIEAELPAGVSLTRVDSAVDVTAPSGTRVRHATVPKLPKVKGPFRTTVNVELANGDERVAEIPVAVVLEISEAAAAPDMRKGGRITVVVEKETLRISTEAILSKDADLGDTVPVTLVATGRTLRVKIISKTRADLVEGVR